MKSFSHRGAVVTSLLILTTVSFSSQQLFPFPAGHNVWSIHFLFLMLFTFLGTASLRGKGKEGPLFHIPPRLAFRIYINHLL